MKKSMYEEKYANSPNSDYLHAKRMQVYQEMGLAKAQDPNFNMSPLEYMQVRYPEEEELIALEELRVQENQQIYDEYVNSGDHRSFQQYAMDEYGFGDTDDLSAENIEKSK